MNLEFEFEDLPLVVDGAFEAGEINGVAEIVAHRDGSYSVDEIWLDGSRRLTRAERTERAAKATLAAPVVPLFERKRVRVDGREQAWLWSAIEYQLERGRFKDSILHKIAEEIEWAA